MEHKLGLVCTDDNEHVPAELRAMAKLSVDSADMEAFMQWMKNGGPGKMTKPCVISTRSGFGKDVDNPVPFDVEQLGYFVGTTWVSGLALNAFIGILREQAERMRIVILDVFWHVKSVEEARGVIAELLQSPSRKWLLSAQAILMPVFETNHWFYLRYKNEEISLVDSLFVPGREIYTEKGHVLNGIIQELGGVKNQQMHARMSFSTNHAPQR